MFENCPEPEETWLSRLVLWAGVRIQNAGIRMQFASMRLRKQHIEPTMGDRRHGLFGTD